MFIKMDFVRSGSRTHAGKTRLHPERVAVDHSASYTCSIAYSDHFSGVLIINRLTFGRRRPKVIFGFDQTGNLFGRGCVCGPWAFSAVSIGYTIVVNQSQYVRFSKLIESFVVCRTFL